MQEIPEIIQRDIERHRSARGPRPAVAGLVLGVSGSRDAENPGHYVYIAEQIYRAKQRGYNTLVHGACTGVDEMAAQAAHLNRMHVHAILPANRGKLARTWEMYSHTYEEAPPHASYLDRDQMIVDQSGALLAYPMYHESDPKARRSGTWATIRMARRKGIPIKVFILTSRADLELAVKTVGS